MGAPLIIAHRGASAYEPENTLKAFEKAIALSADMVEFDVWCTHDGTLIVYHDEHLGQRRISELTYAEIHAVNPEIPTLEAVLACCNGRIRLDVEVKATGYEAEVLDALKLFSGEVVLTSFVPEVLRHVRSLNPAIATGLLVEPEPRPTAAAIAELAHMLGVQVIAPHWSLLDDLTFVNALPNVPLWVWTVNDPDILIPLATNPKVAGIITDYPDLTKHWVAPA